MATSPSGSMKGYSFKVWAVRNIETFKLLGSALAGLATFFMASVPQPWNAFLGVVMTVGGKLILDALHFWQKNVKLE